MKTLTPKQKQILDFITDYTNDNGYSPSLKEIAREFKKTVPTIFQHVETLKEKGFLIKTDNISRGIQLNNVQDEVMLLGKIAAGAPIEPIENPEPIKIPIGMINASGNYYALQVRGNSLVEDGIFDGDTVVIRHQQTAENGETIVAITEDGATLKKLYKENGKIRLQPANQALLPIFPQQLEIRGKVVGIIRKVNQDKTQPKIQTKKTGNKYQRRQDYSWDYKNANTKPYTHVFHQYPAMFIPQVARRLIESYSNRGDTVCDIFCGSGTALVESRLLGRNSIGTDLNPHAILLANAKTHPTNPSKLQEVYLKLVNQFLSRQTIDTKLPNFFNINYWFKQNVIYDLARLKKLILDIKDDHVRKFFFVSFSHTARAASNTRGGEFKLFRIPVDKLKNYNPDVLTIFRDKTEKNIKGMTDFYRDADRTTWVKLIEGDSTKDNGISEKSVDLIITSPPYGDSKTTVAYGQFSRLSMQWLGLINDTQLQIDNEMLGGKAVSDLRNHLPSSYLKSTVLKISNYDEKRARDALSFCLDLEKAMQQAYKILKLNKYFCLVIGNRTVKGIKIPTDFIIAELGENMGFECKDIFIRNIPNKRMPRKNSPTNIAGKLSNTMNEESVIILKKIR